MDENATFSLFEISFVFASEENERDFSHDHFKVIAKEVHFAQSKRLKRDFRYDL